MLPKFIILFLLPFYIYSTWKYLSSVHSGKTVPNLVTWGFWALAPIVSFLASVSTGVDPLSIFSTFTSGFFPLVIFVYSVFRSRFILKFSSLDKLCLFTASMSLVVWYLTKDPFFALLLSIVTDLIAGLPLLINSYKNPTNENPSIYITGIISATITFLIVDSFSIYSIGFAAYIVLINSSIILPVYWNRIKLWKLTNKL
jgi:hypothetical protein